MAIKLLKGLDFDFIIMLTISALKTKKSTLQFLLFQILLRFDDICPS